MLNTKNEETFWCRFIPFCRSGVGTCGWDYAAMNHQTRISLMQREDGVMTKNSYTIPPDDVAGYLRSGRVRCGVQDALFILKPSATFAQVPPPPSSVHAASTRPHPPASLSPPLSPRLSINARTPATSTLEAPSQLHPTQEARRQSLLGCGCEAGLALSLPGSVAGLTLLLRVRSSPHPLDARSWLA